MSTRPATGAARRLNTKKAFVRIVYVEVPYYRLHAQNSDRAAALPATAIEKMAARLEVPMPWEAHEVVYHVDE